MKRTANILLSGLVLLTGFACKKEKYPESETDGKPIFYFRGNIDTTAVYMEAGINDYYMYSSFLQDSNRVYNFKGQLRQISCSNCVNSIGIQINDKQIVSLNAPSRADSGLTLGNYAYLKGYVGSSYSLKFSSSYNKSAESYSWNFGDGSPISNEKNPTHEFAAAGEYYVSLSVTGSNNCFNTIRKKISVGHPMNASIYADTTSPNGLAFSQSVSGGTPPYQYHWDFSDGATSSLANPIHIFPHQGSYYVTLRVTDSKNNTVTTYYNAVTKSDPSGCSANYVIDSQSAIPANNLGLSNVIITWTDNAGKLYTSNNPLQPNTSYFQVLSVENYEANENGQLTKKLHVRFKCNVYNEDKAVSIDNGEAIICVAYK